MNNKCTTDKKIVINWLQLSAYKASVESTKQCLSRRCLANDFIEKQLYSAPQPPDCFINVNLTTIQYETLSFVSIFFYILIYSDFLPLILNLTRGVFLLFSFLCKNLQNLQFSSHIKVNMVSPILFIHI